MTARNVVPDTSVLVRIEREGLSLADVFEQNDSILLSATVIAELLTESKARSEKSLAATRAFVDAFIENSQVVAFGLAEARVFAALRSQSLASGVQRSWPDLQIAAVAVTHGATLITADRRARLDALGLVDVRVVGQTQGSAS